MGKYMRIIYDYNIASAAFCAAIMITVYIPLRTVSLKIRRKCRKTFPEEIARALLAGYIAALVNIVWFPVLDLIQMLTSDPARLGDAFSGGYYARNYEVLRWLFVERKPFVLLHDFEILANIALFVPLGFLLPVAFKKLKWWQVDLICLGATCLVELIQPLVGRACDIDDIIMNTLGGIIGCAPAKLLQRIFGRKREATNEKT